MSTQIKNLETRIALKYDTYANWTLDNETTQAAKTNANLVLLKGEIGLCEIPAGNNSATTAPTVLFKVGDGEKPFKSLNWASAKAADVYSWAKAAKVELVGTDIVFKDADGTVVKDAEGKDVKISLAGFATDNELAAAVLGLENVIGLTDGKLPDNCDSVVAYVNKKTEGIATSSALEDLQDEVDGVKDIIGAVPANSTVVAEITAAKEAGEKAADDLAKGQVATNASNITLLQSADEAFDARLKLLDDANTGRVKVLETTLAGVSEKLENVTNVMDFAGAVEAVPTDFTNYQKGDVIVVTQGADKGKEFVFDGTKFVEFGNSDAEQTAIVNLQNAVRDINSELDAKLDATTGTVTTAIAGVKATADQAALDVAELQGITKTGADSNTELRSDITELQGIVGLSANAGLQKKVAQNEADIAAIQAVTQLILNCGSATECLFTETA